MGICLANLPEESHISDIENPIILFSSRHIPLPPKGVLRGVLAHWDTWKFPGWPLKTVCLWAPSILLVPTLIGP